MIENKQTWTLNRLRSFREQIIEIARRHGASNVRVFGSIARNEANTSSDIDLLIDQDWSRLSSWGGMGLIVELEDLLNSKVDVTTPEEIKPEIRKRVLKDAVPL